MLCRVLRTFITKEAQRIRQGTVYNWEGGTTLPSYLVPVDAPASPEPIPAGQAKHGRKTRTIHDEVIA